MHDCPKCKVDLVEMIHCHMCPICYNDYVDAAQSQAMVDATQNMPISKLKALLLDLSDREREDLQRRQNRARIFNGLLKEVLTDEKQL